MTPLNSNDCFNHMWKILRIVGLNPTKSYKWIYYFYGIVANIFANFLSPIALFLNVYYLQDIGLIIRNLQTSLMLFVSTAKQLVVFTRLSNLRRTEPILTILDKRASLHEQEEMHLRKVIKQCRYILLIVEVTFLSSFFLHAFPDLIRRKLVLEGWITSEQIPSDLLFGLAFMLQVLPVGFQTIQNVSNDSFPPVCLNLIKAHLHVLCMRVARIGNDSRKTLEGNYHDLKSCVEDHRNILRLLDTIRPIISQTVLFQFTVIGALFCLIVFHYLVIDRSIGHLIVSVLYMTSLLSVSFPVCYFGNAITTESENLTTAIFNSNWIEQPMGFKKCIIIFMERSKRENVLYAGGMIKINLQTFISIVNFSFSMFTVLSQLSPEN